MILRGFFTAFASAFAPMAVNHAVHDAKNLKAAAMAGQERMIRLSHQRRAAWDRGDREAVKRINGQQSEVISALDDLARRLDG